MRYADTLFLPIVVIISHFVYKEGGIKVWQVLVIIVFLIRNSQTKGVANITHAQKCLILYNTRAYSVNSFSLSLLLVEFIH